MAAKMIHPSLKKKTEKMSPKQKFDYLHAHKKKKEAKVKSNIAKAKKELFSRPSAK
jgi:hypothetical protein